jgi:hypothetical protein
MDGSYNLFSGKERTAADRWLNKAAKSGMLVWPTRCSICGAHSGRTGPGKIQIHLEDYRRPIEFYSCCVSCHQALHNRFRTPERWRGKLAKYARDGSWFMLISMDESSQHQPFDVTYPDGLPPEDWNVGADGGGAISRGYSAGALARG